MPSVIRVLEDQTINQIAAGEVVESPSSVVKELLENAIDAKASSIVIEIRAGGFQLIKISDDGVGMSYDDVLLSIERHATSKIQKITDLLRVSSMGFRGEALASIASISKLSILTSQDLKNNLGTTLVVNGGKVTSIDKASRQKGTTIDVRALFFNVPARKKFQKSAPMALADISKVVSNIALSNPKIEFLYIVDDKKLIHAKVDPNLSHDEMLKKRAEDVLGKNFVKQSKWISKEFGGFKLKGFLGNPLESRPNRLSQHLFINHRFVVSPEVSFAVSDGYASMLPERRFPVFLLYFDLDQSLLDVNIHPQKKQVKFQDERAVKHFIRQAVGQTLDERAEETSKVSIDMSYNFPLKKDLKNSVEVYRQNFKELKNEIQEDLLPTFPVVASSSFCNSSLAFDKAFIGVFLHFAFFSVNELEELFPEKKDELVLININRLQKKLNFEKLLTSLKSSGKDIGREALLFPEIIKLSKLEAMELGDKLDLFLNLGIELRVLDRDSFVLEALSPMYEINEVKMFLTDQLDQTFFSKEIELEKLYQKLAKKFSSFCKRNINEMSKAEIIALVSKGLDNVSNDYVFDGERVVTFIKEGDLEQLFRKKT